MSGSESVTNILMVGVGGQGIMLASEILSETALLAGYDVTKSEVHGMSQRGGSVNSHVRFGPEVFSPLIPAGQAHFVVALEKLEALRWAGYLVPGGTMIVNDFRLDPVTVTTGKLTYPEDVIERLKGLQDCRVRVVDGQALSVQAGDLRTMNTVVLGALSSMMELSVECWYKAMEERITRKNLLQINTRAFEFGRQAAQDGNKG